MNRDKQYDEIILTVKNAFAENAGTELDGDLAVIDVNDLDHIAEQVAEVLCDKGYCIASEVAKVIFVGTLEAIEKGIAEANERVERSTINLDFREVLVHTGEMYAGHIGLAITEVFRKYTEEEK